MRYGDIYEKFEEIFLWIKEHYPSGGFFVVERDCARFYEGKPTLEIFSNEIKSCVDGFKDMSKINEEAFDKMLNDFKKIKKDFVKKK